MITAKKGEKTVTRNSSFFKLVRQKEGPAEDCPTDGDYDDLEDADGEPENAAQPAEKQPQEQPQEQPEELHRYPQRVRVPPRHLADYAYRVIKELGELCIRTLYRTDT